MRHRVAALLTICVLASGCGVLGGGSDVSGWPDVDLGADEVVEYISTPQRPLYLHVFAPDDRSPAGAVLFFHGGGYATTRVEQFEHQARAVADAGMVGIVVEYRVSADGTTRNDAILDGSDAAAYVVANAAELGVDPTKIALAGSSAGGDLAVNAQVFEPAVSALVLFNPAVGPSDGATTADNATLVFHSREDTMVPFTSAEAFCNEAADCTMVAFDEGDHGFFNNEPALTETTEAMIEFLLDRAR